MLGRPDLRPLAVAVALLAAAVPAQAQQAGGRYQVLIPYFEARGGADRDFGEDAAEELRELINTLPTHAALSEDEIEDRADQFDIEMDDLTCLFAIQLAAQTQVPVVVCASYTEQPDESKVVTASIRTVATNEEFPLGEFTVPARDGEEEAARQIFTQFDRYNTQVRSAQICNDYAASQQWENALRNCDASLEINPNAVSVRYLRGRILYELERYDEALQELETVLAADPLHEEALQLAGYISITQGDDEAGRDYYRRYLEINPGNVAVRMNIAYDMAEAGDPVGAMEFIQVGLDVDPNNVDLLDQYGGFAFRAGVMAQEEWQAANPDAEGLAPEAAEFYRQAIDAYQKVFQARGPETPVDRLHNIIRAYVQLDQVDSAISFAEQTLTTHPDDVQTLSLFADALQRAGRVDEAVQKLDQVLALQPDHPTAALRQGLWLVQLGRMEEAVAKLSPLAERDPQQAQQAAQVLFASAYESGQNQSDYAAAIRTVSAAKQLPNLSDSMRNQLNFWHGYWVFQAAVAEQEPGTVEVAQSTMPKFQQALQLLQQSGDYASTVNVNLQQLTDNVNTYIEIQDAIIRRGGR